VQGEWAAAVRVSRGVAAAVGSVLGFGLAFGGLTVGLEAVERSRCTGSNPEWSVARMWNEQTLDAIRRALPAPTVHARNLFSVSTAMWDAWAAYDPSARGYALDESQTARDVAAARDEAVSYAAYRVLEQRYLTAVGASDSLPAFDALMQSLCFDTEVTTTEGDSPAAVGNRIAAAVIEQGLQDGANEAGGYAAQDYAPANPPLEVAEPGARLVDPNRWQPLLIKGMVTQNGIPVDSAVQTFIGAEWGQVTGFALPPSSDEGMAIDPGEPPRLGDPETDEQYKQGALEVIRFSSQLDPADGATVDISPASQGNNPLGTYDGSGYDENPVTGEPYEPTIVPRADFVRVLAEHWADGPKSETPPGHWNVIANRVSDQLDPELRIGGTGEVVDRLEWDVKLYFALNGATHDAAVAAWGAKGHYDSVRPISMIRYMGGLGQSSDPDAPSYDPEGLPLEPGLVEVVTARTTAPGQRHEALRGHEGEIAIRAWQGRPQNPDAEVGGVGWVRAVEWVPYQLPSFVTPAFAAYVSGHSTFSRAAAEVLTGITGSPYFPGGLAEYRIPKGDLAFEAGPDEDVVLQWAAYADAADQAGISRLYGGIHIRNDDLDGRKVGYQCGQAAWAKAQTYYGTRA
jgi:hypothetical protein